MEIGDKYRLLFPTEYGNFNTGDIVVVDHVMNFPNSNTMFFTIRNIDNKDHVATFKFKDYKSLVFLG